MSEYNTKLAIIIPCFNEELVVKSTVETLLKVLDGIIEKGKIGEIYNIGSNTLIPNIDVIKTILKILNKSESLIDYVTDRPGHDFAYHLNSEKIQNDLNWKECHKFEDALIKTVEWYKSFYI